MPTFPSSVPQPQNCTSISNQGSLVLIGNLTNCADEPTVVTLTITVAAPLGATSLTVSNNLTAGATAYIRKGSRLYFNATIVTVVADVLITAGSTATLPVESVDNNLPVLNSADTWALERVLAPQSIPINEESSTTDISDLTNGLQGSEVVSKLMLNPQIQIVNRFDDRAYNSIISKAARIGGIVYVVFALSDNSHVFGRAIVSGNNREFGQMDVQKPTFNLLMQAPWNSYSSFKYESTANKTLINTARRLAGLNQLT